MNDLVLPSPAAHNGAALDTTRFPATARWVLRLLARIGHGTLDVRLPDGQRARFGRGAPHADITLASWDVFAAALRSGDIGFAESRIAGQWSSTDLVALLALLVRNRAAIEGVVYGSFPGGLLYRLRHLLNRNSRAQAKRNIHAHYDLGNEFYALWLDRSMTYSSALFETPVDPHAPADEETLAAAQDAKYARVLAQIAPAPGARLLEIGCGWGGFAAHAARAGHAVRGLTLSDAQLRHARGRPVEHGIAADLRLQDYRDETGRYDGIASIEMFEAVGEAWWPSYFATLARCLNPGARACVQTITIDDRLFARYRRSTDFIQQYIFPGGMLPSPAAFELHARRAGLRVVDRFAFGHHYAKTLATWRARFHAQQPAVRALGFDDRFLATWDFYLAYCEAAFAERNTDVVQFTLARD
jgi:cyclopropane-fatty-acyl-phospholipid synthase